MSYLNVQTHCQVSPQGSLLSPLLFVLFINDIYTNIDKDTIIALFADDTKIWRGINSEADCEILQTILIR